MGIKKVQAKELKYAKKIQGVLFKKPFYNVMFWSTTLNMQKYFAENTHMHSIGLDLNEIPKLIIDIGDMDAERTIAEPCM